MTDALRTYIDHRETRSDIPVADVAGMFLEAVEAQQHLNAVVEVSHARIEADVQRAEQARSRGERLPLDGMPILVKDNIDVAGLPCRVGSPLFADRVATADAPAVQALSDAGAVILGKAALHELVYGVTTDSPFYGRTRNPWQEERIAGGSSGGSGAAVAAGLCVVALGTDTGGSIRVPGHVNGVVGFRPTFGMVSVRGTTAIGPSLDTLGPLSRWATDSALVHSVIAGLDPADPHSRVTTPASDGPLMRVGRVSPDSLGEVDPEVEARVADGLDVLRRLGCEVTEVHLEDFEEVRRAASRMIQIEAWTRYADDLRAHPDKFSPETQERLILGSDASGAEYVAAQWRVDAWRSKVQGLLGSRFDLLALPVAPEIAPIAGSSHMIAATARLTALTLPISAAHVPAIAIPCGMAHGMPVGIQLAAAPGRDADLLQLAERFQLISPPMWPN